MIIAIPIDNDKLDLHFGHCKEFALITVNCEKKKILSRENIQAPPHEPGLLPQWLAQKSVKLIIAGGIGKKAKDLFDNYGIKVLAGAAQESPENLVNKYLEDTLELGENCCDH